MGRNRLINGDMRVSQRGTSFTAGANNDDTYNLDRWTLLSDGNDIVDVTQANVAPTAGLFSIGLDVETVNKKFGIVQIIEQRNIVGMFNQPVTLSFSARTSGSSIGNLKAVILSWISTADTVTSDVVSAWGTDGVTPTFAANWTAENTPQNLAPSNTWTRYSITATLDTASTNNVAVFIWCDDLTTTLGDFLYIADVQLEVGSLATPFERKLQSQTLAECQRYYEVGATWIRRQNNDTLRSSFDTVYYKVTKRSSTNSVSFTILSATNNGGTSFTAADEVGGYINWTSSSGTDYTVRIGWTVVAEL
jgi:hypothetical protein